MGNYTDDVTLVGTILQVLAGVVGVDLPMDVRDFVYDVTKFEFTKEHIAQTLLDAVAILPVVGGLKHVDEAADVIKAGTKSADEVADVLKAGIKSGNEAVEDIVKTGDDAETIIKHTVKYPGNDPTKAPGEGFEWRGKSTPKAGKGNWYNPNTKEKWNSDLDHAEPIGPHWDYTDSNGKSFRVFPDGRMEPK